MNASPEKLYESDPYIAKFRAQVRKIDGELVELDQTAFYPGGGGQDPDAGNLNGHPVLDVYYKGGVILHKVKGHDLEVGQTVEGEIDWTRRLNLMMGHTGEHILFSSLNRVVPELELVKISITPTKKSVIVKGDIDWDKALEAERLANEAVWKGLRTEDIFVKKDDPMIARARIKIERIPGEVVRLVKIGDFDLAACAGIHVRNTSEIGMILVNKMTSAKPAGDWELEFLVGIDAIMRSLELSKFAMEATDLMGSHPEDLLIAMRNRDTELNKSRESLRANAKRIIQGLQPEIVKGVRVFTETFRGVDRKTLGDEATKKVSDGSSVCVFVDEGERITLVVAVGKELKLDAVHILQKALQDVGGKGGGNKTFATGGAASGKGSDIISLAFADIVSQLHE